MFPECMNIVSSEVHAMTRVNEVQLHGQQAPLAALLSYRLDCGGVVVEDPSSPRVRAGCFKPFQSGQHFLSHLFAAGWLCEPALSQVTKGADHVFDLKHDTRVCLLNLFHLRLKALAGFLHAGVDGG
jgi:hypothetical protein